MVAGIVLYNTQGTAREDIKYSSPSEYPSSSLASFSNLYCKSSRVSNPCTEPPPPSHARVIAPTFLVLRRVLSSYTVPYRTTLDYMYNTYISSMAWVDRRLP